MCSKSSTKTIAQKLCEMCATWREQRGVDHVDDALAIVHLLTDPAPLTQQRLADAGFEPAVEDGVWWCGTVRLDVYEDGYWIGTNQIKTVGQLMLAVLLCRD